MSLPLLTVVGGGAAGMAAAAQLPGKVLVLDRSSAVSISACSIPHYLSGEISGAESLLLNTPQQLQSRGIQVRTNCEVQTVRPNERLLVLRGGEILPYQNLLLAPGGHWAPSGQQYPNVIVPRDLESALRAKAYLLQPQVQKVLVVGGGYLGLELAESAHRCGRQVTLIEPVRPLLGLHSDLEESVLVRFERPNLRLVQDRLVGWKGDDLAQTAILSSGGQVDFDLALVATGLCPAHPWLAKLPFQRGPSGGIRVDRQGRTNLPHIFAAGDCCEVPRRLAPGWEHLVTARSAAWMGQAIGRHLAGESERFPGCIGNLGLRFFDLQIGLTGQTGEYFTLATDQRQTKVCLYWKGPGGPLIGAQVLASAAVAERCNWLALAIDCGLSASQMVASDTLYQPTLSGLWDPVVQAARAGVRRGCEKQAYQR